MTELLASTGAPVYVIELDARLAEKLQRLATQFPNVTVVRNDVLQTDLAQIADGRRVLVYGNLPYYITSPILHHLFDEADQIDEIHIVVQLEVAERLVASPGSRDYAYLSVLTQYFTRPELVLQIPPSAFRPPPEVASALVTLRLPGERAKLSAVDKDQFLKFVKLCFSQKRKTLANNLRSQAKLNQVRAALSALNLRPDVRAEQLSISELAKLGQHLSAL